MDRGLHGAVYVASYTRRSKTLQLALKVVCEIDLNPKGCSRIIVRQFNNWDLPSQSTFEREKTAYSLIV